MIFFSYSRRDATLVEAMNALLVAAERQTFLDTDPRSIPAGSDWFATITTSIERCDRMFLLWCRHASRSTHVREEYSLALHRNKTVVPISLDRTSLPPMLARYQAIHDDSYKRLHRLNSLKSLAWRVGTTLLIAGSLVGVATAL